MPFTGLFETKNNLFPSGEIEGLKSLNFPENGAMVGSAHLPFSNAIHKSPSRYDESVDGDFTPKKQVLPSGVNAALLSSKEVLGPMSFEVTGGSKKQRENDEK
ncbi:MAG: hypothetical protein WDO15_08540 [Bacteroidota bacterium]